jgi:hypothetical protein
VVCLWCACGVLVVCLWCACGVLVVCLWCACGVLVVCSWDVQATVYTPGSAPEIRVVAVDLKFDDSRGCWIERQSLTNSTGLSNTQVFNYVPTGDGAVSVTSDDPYLTDNVDMTLSEHSENVRGREEEGVGGGGWELLGSCACGVWAGGLMCVLMYVCVRACVCVCTCVSVCVGVGVRACARACVGLRSCRGSRVCSP